MGAWLPDPLDDQHLAGGILWGAGDLIGLVFFAVLFAQWVRSSMREARAGGPPARPARGEGARGVTRRVIAPMTVDRLTGRHAGR